MILNVFDTFCLILCDFQIILCIFKTIYFAKINKLTNAAKIKLALKGDFLKLLKLKDLDDNEIGDINTLNAMIKNDKWLNIGDHRKMITLVGVRIPVQALNSAESSVVFDAQDIPSTDVIDNIQYFDKDNVVEISWDWLSTATSSCKVWINDFNGTNLKKVQMYKICVID